LTDPYGAAQVQNRPVRGFLRKGVSARPGGTRDAASWGAGEECRVSFQ
jgi:hypothetical protein